MSVGRKKLKFTTSKTPMEENIMAKKKAAKKKTAKKKTAKKKK